MKVAGKQICLPFSLRNLNDETSGFSSQANLEQYFTKPNNNNEF